MCAIDVVTSTIEELESKNLELLDRTRISDMADKRSLRMDVTIVQLEEMK